MLMLNKHAKCLDRLKDYDMFGTDIKFFYKGQEVYTTMCGSVVTMVALVAYLTLAIIKSIEFFGMTDPDMFFTETHQSYEEPLDLTELGFSFAIENFPSEESGLVVELHSISWDGYTGEKLEEEIPLEPCTTLPNKSLQLDNAFTSARLKEDPSQRYRYLCPPPEAALQVQGSFFDEVFTYVRLRVRAAEARDVQE